MDKNIQNVNKQRRIDDMDAEIENKIKEFKNMDRTITYGNSLNDPGYQLRGIEYQDKEKLREINNLIKEKEKMVKDIYKKDNN